jgi:hypothetical protein
MLDEVKRKDTESSIKARIKKAFDVIIGAYLTSSNLFSVTVGQYNSPFSLSSPQAAQSRSMFIVGAGNPHYKQNALEIYNDQSFSPSGTGSIIIRMPHLPTSSIGIPTGSLFSSGSTVNGARALYVKV